MKLLMAFIATVAFAGFAGREQLTLPENHLPVPIIRQATGYSCGAAAVLAVLVYWQKDGDQAESDLYVPLGTSEEEGTHPRRMATHLETYGLDVRFKENATIEDLRSALRAGETVILDLQAWRVDPTVPWEETWEDGHYVILVAMDSRYAYFADSSAPGGYTYMPIEELPKRWHDYENENGERRPYFHLGIFVKGKKSLKAYPSSLIRLE